MTQHRSCHRFAVALALSTAAALMFRTGPAHGQPYFQARTPCDGIDQSLAHERVATLTKAIDIQLKSPTPPVRGIVVFGANANLGLQVLRSWRYDGWSIIFAVTDLSDPLYLFYPRDPETSNFVAVWGGMIPLNPDNDDAAAEAQRNIQAWAIREVPDIPRELAGCFAWYVVVEVRQ